MAEESKPPDSSHVHRYIPSLSRIVRVDDDITTIVLLHCDCGDFSHSRLPGEWTFEEITRRPSQPESDAQFLSKIGVADQELQ